jgi:aspartate/methionine/tyrosine aminotransferase
MKNKFVAKRYWVEDSTAMGKSAELSKQFDDLINLSLGDPDMVTPEVIIEKAFKDAKNGHTKYTDFSGDPELKSEICCFYKDEYNMDVNNNEIFVTTSGCHAMYLTLETIIDEGDEVIIQSPFFTPYPHQVRLARGVPVEFPTYEEENYQINKERLEELITGKTKAIIINSPSNPTGSCLTAESLNIIAETAKKHDLVVIADDIYTAFSYEHPFIPIASLPGMRERTITINSFSKNFLMTGWRIGNIVAPYFIVEVVQLINENVVFTAPSVSQRAAIHALRHRNEIQPEIIEEFKMRMMYAAERINKLHNMHVIYPPKGTFYLFPSIKGTGLSSEEAADIILNEAHVLVLPGNAFGTSGEGYIRIACTVNKDKLKEAFDRIERLSIFKK